MWSAITFSDGDSRSQSPAPAASTAFFAASSKRWNKSIWNTLCTPCNTVLKRSSPMPVSTLGFGSLCITPSSVRLNCMKTLFQIST